MLTGGGAAFIVPPTRALDLCQAPMRHRLFHGTMAGLTLVLATFSVWGARANDIRVVPSQVLPPAGIAALLLAAARFYRWRRADKLVNFLLMAFWTVVTTIVYPLLMVIAARQPFPLQDGLFARIDRMFGLQAPEFLRWAHAIPTANRLLELCYDLLVPLIAVALVTPPLVDRMRAAKECAMACVAAAMISMPIFAVLPAIGPWTQYGYAPTAAQHKCELIMRHLKEPGVFVLDLRYSEGVIAFPSFHTILALLAAVALWPVPYLRRPAAALAGLITLSALTSGWHYLIDVTGGLIIALLCVTIAKGFTRLETRMDRWAVRRAGSNPQDALEVPDPEDHLG